MPMTPKRPLTAAAGQYGSLLLLGLLGLFFACRSAVPGQTRKDAAWDDLSAHPAIYQQLVEKGYAKKSTVSRHLAALLTKDGQGLYVVSLSFDKKSGLDLPCLVTRPHSLLNTAKVDGVYVEDSVAFALRLEQTLAELKPAFTAGALDSIRQAFLIGGQRTLTPQYLNPYYLRQR
jgi:hypothetical protein